MGDLTALSGKIQRELCGLRPNRVTLWSSIYNESMFFVLRIKDIIPCVCYLWILITFSNFLFKFKEKAKIKDRNRIPIVKRVLIIERVKLRISSFVMNGPTKKKVRNLGQIFQLGWLEYFRALNKQRNAGFIEFIV